MSCYACEFSFADIKACGPEGRDCCHTLGVLRVSLGCFVSFFLLHLYISSEYIKYIDQHSYICLGGKFIFSDI